MKLQLLRCDDVWWMAVWYQYDGSEIARW